MGTSQSERKSEKKGIPPPPSTGTTHPPCGRELRPGRPTGGGRKHQGGRAIGSPHGKPSSLAPRCFFPSAFFLILVSLKNLTCQCLIFIARSACETLCSAKKADKRGSRTVREGETTGLWGTTLSGVLVGGTISNKGPRSCGTLAIAGSARTRQRRRLCTPQPFEKG